MLHGSDNPDALFLTWGEEQASFPSDQTSVWLYLIGPEWLDLGHMPIHGPATVAWVMEWIDQLSSKPWGLGDRFTGERLFLQNELKVLCEVEPGGRNNDSHILRSSQTLTYRWLIIKMQILTQFRSVQFSRSVMSDSLRPHESQHARPPCPSPTPGVLSDSRPSSRWYHPAISSSVVPCSSCPQSLPASESSPMSQLFAWGGQSIGVLALASFLPKKSQGWSPSEWTGWISLQSKGLSRVFSPVYNPTNSAGF